MIQRMVIVSALLFGAAGYFVQAMQAEVTPLREPLRSLPLQLPGWTGFEGPAFDSKIEQVLGADEYVNRIYSSGSGPAVGLYIGYYASQRQGDTMHSPLNCLPGAGWEPVQQDRASLTVASPASASQEVITVNQFVIQKGLDRQLVMYWYQSHGRVIASEYTSKIFMVYDAMRLNRTDGAMVRVITPIIGESSEATAAATERTSSFVKTMFPQLARVLPS